MLLAFSSGGLLVFKGFFCATAYFPALPLANISEENSAIDQCQINKPMNGNETKTICFYTDMKLK